MAKTYESSLAASHSKIDAKGAEDLGSSHTPFHLESEFDVERAYGVALLFFLNCLYLALSFWI